MTGTDRTISGESYKEIFLVILSLILHLAIASQLYFLSRDILSGDGSVSELSIPLRYPPMRVPETPATSRDEANGRLCADFAQVYFPSRDESPPVNAYAIETTSDPWSRPSKYPPFVHFIFAHALSRLSYGPASLLHLIVQALLFYASWYFAFRTLKLGKPPLPSLLLMNACLFLTPVGLSWLERGQFTLYVGLAYLWLLLAVITGKKRYAAVSAVFASVKWTALPFAFTVLAVYLLHADNRRELKERLLLSALFAGVGLLLFCMFPRENMHFLDAITSQEMTFSPQGISLAQIAPRYAVKALPLLLIAAGWALRMIHVKQMSSLLPFFAGSAVLLSTYPTFAYDYSVPSLFALVPFMLYWTDPSQPGKHLRRKLQVSFSLFLVLASFSVIALFGSEHLVILLYLVASLLLIALPFTVGAGKDASDQKGRRQSPAVVTG